MAGADVIVIDSSQVQTVAVFESKGCISIYLNLSVCGPSHLKVF